MAQPTRSLWDEVKSRYSIKQYLVENGIEFTEKGENLKLSCPLPGHSDSTPSFSVKNDVGFFHCFGCGKKGSVIDLAGLLENKPPWEVLRQFKSVLGIKTLEGTQWHQDEEKYKELEEFLTSMSLSALKYNNDLFGDAEVTDYLKTARGLSQETIVRFCLGWMDHKKCVAIPLFNEYGKVTCFVEHYFGRFRGDKQKYILPSSQHPAVLNGSYSKANYLYNLHNVRLENDGADDLYIVEGYFDAMAMHQMNFTNTVAIGSAIMTRGQVSLLHKHTNNTTSVVFIPDADEPGYRACISNIKEFKLPNQGYSRNLGIIALSDGTDDIKDANDWLIKTGGAELPAKTYAEIYELDEYFKKVDNVDGRFFQLKQIAKGASLPIKYALASYAADELGMPKDRIVAELDAPLNQDVGDIYLDLRDLSPLRQYAKECREFGIYAGFGERLNACLLGFRPGEVVGLAARSNVGKTTAACNYIIEQVARNSLPNTVFFSLEMTKEEISMKLLSQMQERAFDEFEEDFAKGADSLNWADCPIPNLTIVSGPALSVADISKHIDYLEKTFFEGDKVQQIIIDHLGMIRPEYRCDRYERISQAAQDIQSLTKFRKLVTIILLQVNRADGKSGGEEITMASIRDSGVVEESTDIIIGMWVPDFSQTAKLQKGDPTNYRRVHFKVLKSRRKGREAEVEADKGDNLRFAFMDDDPIEDEEPVETPKVLGNDDS